MKKYLVGFFYSLPVQLLLLHIRRYQVLLVFWYILFATISGHFMESYGAYTLYLAPEYLDKVNALSSSIVGFSVAIFIMSWNITTFILHSKHIKFLATTAQPFLKYCINNAIIPLSFLITYFIYAWQYQFNQELIGTRNFVFNIAGFLGGFILSILIAFTYFFGADKTIYRSMKAIITSANRKYERSIKSRRRIAGDKTEIRVDWFLSASFGLRKPRNVNHYSQLFLDSIFKRHHLAAILAIFLSFLFLIATGYFSNSRTFQVPAAASITVFFAILIAFAGAISLFLHSWSLLVLVATYVLVNWMYINNIIDPRNKAYGLNYANEDMRPTYDPGYMKQLIDKKNIDSDKAVFIQMLDNWKAKQHSDTPVMYIINVSGGGVRSATFVMNVLQRLDSVTNGHLMDRTFLINGASGGIIGASYFRALYQQKINGANINLHDAAYADDISKDLLNPLFSSFVSRDLLGPVRRFTYNGFEYKKDRGYAFEQKLNYNTHGLLNTSVGSYTLAEGQAKLPLMFFNSVVTRDGRQMLISTHPARFLMKPFNDSTHIEINDPDVIDFNSFFHNQHATDIKILSAIRMNATFPYVLPNVWLPSTPVIDVMDAGLRDNFGQQTTVRFIHVFREWLQKNTSKVIIIQIRDRPLGDWENTNDGNSMLSLVTKPFLLLQNNWQRLQDYYQTDEVNFISDAYGPDFYRINFQYVPQKQNENASLSFHLTASEKVDIAASLNNTINQQSLKKIIELSK
jgi:hypothetical protein